jgi:hypothetical protein
MFHNKLIHETNSSRCGLPILDFGYFIMTRHPLKLAFCAKWQMLMGARDIASYHPWVSRGEKR